MLSHGLQSAASQVALSQSGRFLNGAQLQARDENICTVQKAVVRPQTANPCAHSARVSAFTFYSTGEGE